MNIKDYKFNVGDKVITTDGVVGKITSICTCSQCEERGFYEPTWENEYGDEYYITINDAIFGFNTYYQIGEYHFNGLDKDEVLYDMAFYERELKKLKKQLKVIEELETEVNYAL